MQQIINNQDVIDNTANKFLGKQLTDYKTNYDPTLLVPIDRELNRKDYGIKSTDFEGYDIWHNYECSFMTNKGYPLSLVGKIKIPASSKYFVESKSMKLYFFSFHMEKMGDTIDEAIENYVEIVKRDLSVACQAPVEFQVFDSKDELDIFEGYVPVEELVDIESLEFNNFKESADLLESDNENKTLKVVFKNVRSNCRVTHQPDFANLYLYISGTGPTLKSILKYVVSFRNEFHFHEEVTEQIFHNLSKYDVQLAVCNLFTRRGGLDICPVRATSLDLIDSNFLDVETLPARTVYQ